MKLKELCRTDVVIDTNVLSHAGNPNTDYQDSSLKILQWLRSSTVVWVLDDHGKSKPNLTTSLMWTEYCATLPPQSIGIEILQYLLQSERVRFAQRPTADQRRKINALIPHNKSDRVVLGAVLGTVDKVLVSNDLTDFSPSVRRQLQSRWDVSVLTSKESAASEDQV